MGPRCRSLALLVLSLINLPVTSRSTATPLAALNGILRYVAAPWLPERPRGENDRCKLQPATYDDLCGYIDNEVLSGFSGKVPNLSANQFLTSAFGGEDRIVTGCTGRFNKLKMVNFGFAFVWLDGYVVALTGCTD